VTRVRGEVINKVIQYATWRYNDQTNEKHRLTTRRVAQPAWTREFITADEAENK